ncbi:DMT family transporter [Bdellovibrio sp. 22V]|uniref:DMT family transporter n=1 Tax=Bdellovibrio TaxID=958 RepID=UPI0025434DB0|nr:DMT family transporter [Bdellovibrio sp. 22V]WII71598.1 DMT family transporter [Bdellovibrio sp. 22V]
MTLGPLLLLFSAFLHASWNAIAKSAKDKESFLFLTILLSGLITLGIVLTYGGFQIPSGKVGWISVLSGVFEGLYFITLAKALKESALGKAYSIMRGGAMIIVWLVSTIFFAETAGLFQYFGAFLIFLGIVVMNFKGFSGGNLLNGSFWSAMSAVFIAGYHLSYHQALAAQADPRSLFCIAMLVSLPFLFWSLREEPIKRLRHTLTRHPWAVMVTGSAATGSFLIFLYGLQVSAPGFAISLRNTSIFFAVLFSYFLKESLSRLQIVGACGIGLGAVLLSL